MNDINLDKELVWWEARIIQEFCCHGDLKKALKQAKVDGQTIGEDNKPTPPLFNAAVRLALDAAAGMAYIHSMKVASRFLVCLLMCPCPWGSSRDNTPST